MYSRLGNDSTHRLYSSFCPPVLSADPFADATKGDDLLPSGTEDKIHIRIQQRNGRKTLTTVQGIAHDYDKKKLVKAFKKVLITFVVYGLEEWHLFHDLKIHRSAWSSY